MTQIKSTPEQKWNRNSRRIRPGDAISVVAVVLITGLYLAPSAAFTGLMIVVAGVTAGWLAGHAEHMPEVLVIAAYLGVLHVKLDIGGLNLRANMFVAIIGMVWALGGKSHIPLSRWFLALNAAYLLSTLLHPNAPFFHRGLADCFLLTINLAQYAIVSRCLHFDRLLRLLFLSSSASYSVLVVLYLFVGAGWLPSLGWQETPEILRLTLLGTTEGAYIVFTLGTLLFYIFFFGFPFSKAFTAWCLVSHVLAFALSFSRAAWLALLLAFLLFWCFALVRFPLRRAFIGTGVLALFLFPIGIAGYRYLSRDTLQALSDRAQSMSVEEGTVVDRVILWSNMLDDWRLAPVLGHGAHDYAKFRQDPINQISENYTLELLHSGGLVTAGLFVLGMLALASRTMPWSWTDAVNRPWSLPLVAGFSAMSLSALTNPAMTGGLYWIGAGLLVLCSEPRNHRFKGKLKSGGNLRSALRRPGDGSS
jgi:O-Antigen ligase